MAALNFRKSHSEPKSRMYAIYGINTEIRDYLQQNSVGVVLLMEKYIVTRLGYFEVHLGVIITVALEQNCSEDCALKMSENENYFLTNKQK